MRFALIRCVLPQAAIAAATEAVERWWDSFIAIWDPRERQAWRDAQRAEALDADMIDHGWHGGFAAGSGGDEG